MSVCKETPGAYKEMATIIISLSMGPSLLWQWQAEIHDQKLSEAAVWSSCRIKYNARHLGGSVG